MTTTRQELLQSIAELGELFPDWRFGQLVANLASATAHGANAQAIWDSEDTELLDARRLVQRNQDRRQIPA